MSTRGHYEKMFADYPDLVWIKDFRVMLGGVTEETALKILEQGKIKFYYNRRRHLIPKNCVIDYLMGVDCTSQEVKLLAQELGKHRRPGTGCLYQINDHLWEGKYSPRNAHGKRGYQLLRGWLCTGRRRELVLPILHGGRNHR